MLLRPSSDLTEITLGILGRAQRYFPVRVHAFIFLSNHYHLLVSPSDAQQLSHFMGFVNSNLAREAGRLHDWREKFWGRRYQAIVVSDEAAAQVGRLRYLLSQGSKEGLVAKPSEWPGCTSLPGLLGDMELEGTWFDRSAEYEARRRSRKDVSHGFATRETVFLAPLPCWAQLSRNVQRREIEAMLAAIEADAARECEESGRDPLGVAAIQAQPPHLRPMRAKNSVAPLIHAASRRVRLRFQRAYREFVGAFRLAAARIRSGDLSATFPSGAFPPALPWVPEPAPS